MAIDSAFHKYNDMVLISWVYHGKGAEFFDFALEGEK